MFHQTRLKLTFWYLLISMIISILFSFAIYRGATMEVERSLRAQRVRFYRETHPFDDTLPDPSRVTIDPQILDETNGRIALTLVLINTGIFIIAGGAGYFLAGRTLKPIQDMVEQQKHFITDASHELRTPLTALRSEIEVGLRDTHMNISSARKLLESNLEEIDHLQGLSDTLLELSQIQQNENTTIFEPLSLSDAIDAAIRKVAPIAKSKDITFKKRVGSFVLRGEKQSIIQLFVILLDNAVKYSNNKKTVAISAHTTDHSVSIAVTDQGVGIDKNDIAHIFERFYRTDASRSKQKTAGYGLGLAIGKKIVEMHHGSINVTSVKGKGTTFTIILPKDIS